MTRWKLVPVEPTTDMNADGAAAVGRAPIPAMTPIWTAMLSASPSPGEDVVEKVAFALFCHEHGVPTNDERDTGVAQKWWAAKNSKGAARRSIYRARVRAVIAALEG